MSLKLSVITATFYGLMAIGMPIPAIAQTPCITEDDVRRTNDTLEGIEGLSNDVKLGTDFRQAYDELKRLSGDVISCRERRREAIISLESCAPEIEKYNDQVDQYNQIKSLIDNRATFVLMENALKHKLLRPRCAMQ